MSTCLPAKPNPFQVQTDPDFTAILRNSLLRQMSHKATCQTCKHFSNFSSRRSIASRDLPPILAINASVYTPESFSYWRDNKNQTFLKPQIELHGQVEGVDDPEGIIYSLRVGFLEIRVFCWLTPRSPWSSRSLPRRRTRTWLPLLKVRAVCLSAISELMTPQ